jgi:hypothetical protein
VDDPFNGYLLHAAQITFPGGLITEKPQRLNCNSPAFEALLRALA